MYGSIYSILYSLTPYLDKILGGYQCGFWQYIFCICQWFMVG